MNFRKEQISQRLTVLVNRLRRLETEEVPPYEKPMVEVGVLALKDKIQDLGRQLKAC